jgi:hypothetical protein
MFMSVAAEGEAMEMRIAGVPCKLTTGSTV